MGVAASETTLGSAPVGGSAAPSRPFAPSHPLPAGMRDLLPGEAASRRRLARRVLEHFSLSGYSLVIPPAFELAEVLERGLGMLEPREVLRFVEPETGEVAALRPDMTPQIARMAATRLFDRPAPMRLCYEGTVLRRRHERARRHRQILQAGVELIGVPGPEGDLELLCLAESAVRAAGLAAFVVDIGHADIARALVGGLAAPLAADVLDALARKDEARLADIVRQGTLPPAEARALAELPRLHGDRAVWREADALLGGTAAAAPLATIRDLWDRAVAEGLEPVLRVDLGEVRGFAYYTGPIFHLLADGPGEPIGSGGRYDDLLARFDFPMPAAGFALDLDNLAWALRAALREDEQDARVLVAAAAPRARKLCAALRDQGIACAPAPGPDAADPRAYARAWGFTHVVRPSAAAAAAGIELETVAAQEGQGGYVEQLSGNSDGEIAVRLAPKLKPR